MYRLNVCDRVTKLRFLPDGRLVLVHRKPNGDEKLAICRLPDGGLTESDLPSHGLRFLDRLGVHPGGEFLLTVWGRKLYRVHTDTGGVKELFPESGLSDLVIHPAGDQLVVSDPSGSKIWRLQLRPRSVRVLAEHSFDDEHNYLGGVLPDGERIVIVGFSGVTVRRLDTFEVTDTARYLAYNINAPALSPGRGHLGVIGYKSMYVYDTDPLGKPKVLTGASAFGNFVDFAFHPTNNTMAVIHGGPTLIKLYDLDTMNRIATYRWRSGHFTSVAFSHDGLLGAAGTEDGTVVVWDVE